MYSIVRQLRFPEDKQKSALPCYIHIYFSQWHYMGKQMILFFLSFSSACCMEYFFATAQGYLNACFFPVLENHGQLANMYCSTINTYCLTISCSNTGPATRVQTTWNQAMCCNYQQWAPCLCCTKSIPLIMFITLWSPKRKPVTINVSPSSGSCFI